MQESFVNSHFLHKCGRPAELTSVNFLADPEVSLG